MSQISTSITPSQSTIPPDIVYHRTYSAFNGQSTTRIFGKYNLSVPTPVPPTRWTLLWSQGRQGEVILLQSPSPKNMAKTKRWCHPSSQYQKCLIFFFPLNLDCRLPYGPAKSLAPLQVNWCATLVYPPKRFAWRGHGRARSTVRHCLQTCLAHPVLVPHP